MSVWSGSESYAFSGLLGNGKRAERTVYCKGQGPSILLLQELPGIGPETLGLAERLIADGFRVHLPVLFGPFGTLQTVRNSLRVFCIRREFGILRRGKQGPIASWLRALCRAVASRDESQGIGVVGMCLTGSFAIAMMVDDAVLAAVASQPSLPMFGGGALPMTDEDAEQVRAATKAKGPALAMRYKGDRIASQTLFDALSKAFGDGLVSHEFSGKEHSLLTLHFHSEAYEISRDYLRSRL